MVKQRFSKPIRVNITAFFSLLLRKNEKQISRGVVVAGSPTAASATQGWASHLKNPIELITAKMFRSTFSSI
jgi:hypothetical protein